MLLIDAVDLPIAPYEQSSNLLLSGRHKPFAEVLMELDGANAPSLCAAPSAVRVYLKGSHPTRHTNETQLMVNAEPLAL